MSTKTRLVTVILAGVLLGLTAIKIQRSSVSLDRALVSADDSMRNAALVRFRELPQKEKNGVMEALVNERFRSQNPRERVFALYALRKSGWNGPRVTATMIKGLRDGDDAVRQEAVVGLLELGKPGIAAVMDALSDPDVRAASGDVLQQIPPELVDEIGKSLAGGPAERRAAAYALSRIERSDTRDAARPFLPRLTALLKSDDAVLAANAAFAVHNLNPKDARPAAVFLAAIRKRNWDAWNVRGWDALEALAEMPEARSRTLAALREIFPRLKDGLMKNKRYPRPAAGDALNKLSPRSGGITALVNDLKSADPMIRWRAAYAISSASKVDIQAVGPLVAALDDRDPAVAARAFYALDRIGLKSLDRVSAKAYPKLVNAFARINGAAVPGFWSMAAGAIGRLGHEGLALTLASVKTGEMEITKAAAVARSVPAVADPAKTLMESLRSDNADVRLVAALALAKVDRGAPGVAAELEAQLPKRPKRLQDDIRGALKLVGKG